MNAHPRAWTAEQRALVADRESDATPDEVLARVNAAGPARTRGGLVLYAQKIGQPFGRPYVWTRKQRELVYALAGRSATATILAEVNRVGPPHTCAALQQWAQQRRLSLRVRSTRSRGPKVHWPWNRHQEARLRRLVGTLPMDQIAARLNAEFGTLRTAASVRTRAAELGVSIKLRTLGLMDLQAVLPVNWATLRRWVDEGLLCAERRGHRGSPWRFREADVEAFVRAHPDLVDWRRVKAGRWRALARAAAMRSAWLGTTEVARRYGVPNQRVTDWCIAGLVPGARKVGGGAVRCRRWRIPAASLDHIERLVEERLGKRRSA